MSEQPLTLSVSHDCVIDGKPVRHTAPVTITEITAVTLGTRYRGTRCDGSRIEWVEPR